MMWDGCREISMFWGNGNGKGFWRCEIWIGTTGRMGGEVFWGGGNAERAYDGEGR
jgi:hypothetical protein